MIQLRSYQQEAIQKLDDCRNKGLESAILALPTGSGKTLTAAAWTVRWAASNPPVEGERPPKFLWLTHRIELLEQAREAFCRLGLKPTEWTQERKDDSGNVVLAMVGSCRALRGAYDTVVIDEAHHAAAPSYQAVLRSVLWNFKLGLTATPSRLDKKALGFQAIAYQTSFADMVRDGFLAEPLYVRVQTGQRHRLHVRDGDFTAVSLRELDNDVRNRLVADVWKGRNWGKTLVFAADIDHACNLLKEFREVPPALGLTSETIHSKMPAEHRRLIVEEFRNKKGPMALINVGIFVEGFDVPDIRTVFLTRPTASEGLFLQMVGRGSRRAEGKELFNIVDFVDDIGKFNLLGKRWASEHLGSKETRGELENEAEIAKIVGVAEQLEVSKAEIKLLKAEPMRFAGVIRWRSKFHHGKSVLVSTELFDSYTKLKILLSRRPVDEWPKVIDSSFALCEVAPEMEFKLWKDLAWSTWADMYRNSGQVDFTEFRKPVTDPNQQLERLRKLSEEIDVTKIGLAPENHAYGPEYCTNRIQSLNDDLYWLYGLHQVVELLEYSNRILHVHSNRIRATVSGRLRKQIREHIVDRFAPIDGDIELVFHWR